MKSPGKAETPNVALIVDTATTWGRNLIEGVIDFVDQHTPWHLQVESSGTMESRLPPPGWDGDGIIARASDPKIVQWLNDTKLPVINISAIQLPRSNFPCVTTDYKASAAIACQYYLNRGFQNFAYVGPLKHQVVNDYYTYFKAELAAHKQTCLSFDLPYNYEDRRNLDIRTKKLQDWLIQLPKPIAIVSWGNDAGREIIDACNRKNILVPHDVAVLGTDTNKPLDKASHPSLSCIQTPSYQIGWTAAEMLDRLFQGLPLKEHRVLFPPTKISSQLSTDTLAIRDKQLIQALQFIRDYAYQAITMDDILAHVPMSRRLLEQKFRKQLGRSPMAEVTRLRISKARRLLADTDMTMQEIAEACGYSTYNYMSYLFKRETGVPPTEYRQSSRQAKL
tara:strand:+ start:12661 stop:13839 length:1179 start_codon:yes stop_codon:yes gene_type:complete